MEGLDHLSANSSYLDFHFCFSARELVVFEHVEAFFAANGLEPGDVSLEALWPMMQFEIVPGALTPVGRTLLRIVVREVDKILRRSELEREKGKDQTAVAETETIVIEDSDGDEEQAAVEPLMAAAPKVIAEIAESRLEVAVGPPTPPIAADRMEQHFPVAVRRSAAVDPRQEAKRQRVERLGLDTPRSSSLSRGESASRLECEKDILGDAETPIKRLTDAGASTLETGGSAAECDRCVELSLSDIVNNLEILPSYVVTALFKKSVTQQSPVVPKMSAKEKHKQSTGKLSAQLHMARQNAARDPKALARIEGELKSPIRRPKIKDRSGPKMHKIYCHCCEAIADCTYEYGHFSQSYSNDIADGSKDARLCTRCKRTFGHEYLQCGLLRCHRKGPSDYRVNVALLQAGGFLSMEGGGSGEGAAVEDEAMATCEKGGGVEAAVEDEVMATCQEWRSKCV